MIVIGIDPGVNGAIAVLAKGKMIDLFDMPTMPLRGKKLQVNGAELAKLLLPYRTGQVVIEEVHSMPKQGVASSFNFGMHYGVVQGVIAAIPMSFSLINPRVWKSAYGLIGKEKDASRSLAQQLFPEASLARKKDADRADALLIARYASP